jgi:hypothetical protein
MIKKILVRFLATVGACSLLGFGGYVVVSRLRPVLDPPLGHSLPSPDGKYKAMLLIEAGGGAGSGYCDTQVLIIPESYDERIAALKRNRYEVYSGGCDELPGHDGSPKLEWVSDNNLKITLSINSSAQEPEDVRLRKLDDSQQVRVTFVVEPQ